MIHLHDPEPFAPQSLPSNSLPRPLLAQLLQDESGQDLIEYALVAALIGLAAVGAMRGLSSRITASFNTVGNTLSSAI